MCSSEGKSNQLLSFVHMRKFLCVCVCVPRKALTSFWSLVSRHSFKFCVICLIVGEVQRNREIWHFDHKILNVAMSNSAKILWRRVGPSEILIDIGCLCLYLENMLPKLLQLRHLLFWQRQLHQDPQWLSCCNFLWLIFCQTFNATLQSACLPISRNSLPPEHYDVVFLVFVLSQLHAVPECRELYIIQGIFCREGM